MVVLLVLPPLENEEEEEVVVKEEEEEVGEEGREGRIPGPCARRPWRCKGRR